MSFMKKWRIKKHTKYLALCLIMVLIVSIYGKVIWVKAADMGEIVTLSVAELPNNPIHHCTKKNDGSDKTNWSYVYFGSYPQTEITGEALTKSIKEADYDSNGDAWIDGIKYRRICQLDTANNDHFGDNYFSYFKWERIQWKVLKNDGAKLLLLANKGLVVKQFYKTGKDNPVFTWENSLVRKWLNDNFYYMAFSNREQKAIIRQTLENNRGNSTQDNIYLLSANEASNSDYGFCEEDSVCSVSRIVEPSDYAYVRGTPVNTTDSQYLGNCSLWWMRTAGDDSYSFCNGRFSGDISKYANVNYNETVVPVVNISLSSELWYSIDDGSSGEGGSIDTSSEEKQGGYIAAEDLGFVGFGSYPQTEVLEDELTTEIVQAAYDANGDAYVDGIKYRRISSEDTNKTDFFGDDSKYRYFKWERLKWRVLDDDGTSLFVVADQGIDCKNFNMQFIDEGLIWENCTLRKWLNDTFYHMAFSDRERQGIVRQSVVNEDPYFGTESGNNTQDYIYLLSVGEVVNSKYWFCEDSSVYSRNHRLQASDYAHAMGVMIDRFDYKGSCRWWLRSPGASFMEYNGHIQMYGGDAGGASSPYFAVVPALHIDLSSINDSDYIRNIATDTCDISLEYEKVVYTGDKYTPEIVVRYDKISLKEDKDYTVEYQNNINAGTASVVISGIGDYTGTVVKTFQIQKASLRDASVEMYKMEYEYDGSAIYPSVIVKMNGSCLEENYDYLITYIDNVNVGTATVEITGIGNYIETVTVQFFIKDTTEDNISNPIPDKIKDISDPLRCNITLSFSKALYTGAAWKPVVSIIFDGVFLIEGTDYTVVYKNNVTPGVAEAVISGMGIYTGTVSKSFLIQQKNIEQVKGEEKNPLYTIISSKEVSYTGSKVAEKNVTIPATVKLNGKIYKVTAIADRAFSKTNIKSVSIGKNIKKIGKKAFYQCKKLKKITVKSNKLTAKKIGSQAFKNINNEVIIKVPKKKLKLYKKVLKKAGLPSGAAIKGV